MLLDVAANASNDEKKRRHVLCQFYDEAARREWCEMASRGDADFRIERVCQKQDRDLLETARLEYDNAYAPKATHDGYEVPQVASSAGPRQGKRFGRKGAHAHLRCISGWQPPSLLIARWREAEVRKGSR